MIYSVFPAKLNGPQYGGPRVSGVRNVNYSLARAVAILREAHAEMAAAEARPRACALADLEMLGVRTGALRVKPMKRRRSPRAA